MWVYQALTILLIFSLPFIPNQYVDANNKSLIAPLILLFGILLLPIFFRTLFGDFKRKFIPTICFFVFLIPATIATVFSADKHQSIFQLRLFISYFVIFVSIHSVFPRLKNKELLTSSFLLLTSVLSLVSLYNTAVRHLVNRESVSFLWIFYGHNHLSALLVFAIPLCLYFLFVHWKNSKVLPLIFAVLFLLVISLLFTFSIGAMISLAISFLIGLVLFGKTFGKTLSSKKIPLKKVYFMVFLIIALFGISSLYFFSETKGLKTIDLKKNPSVHVSDRFVYWQRAFDNYLQKPFTGSGLDTFHIVTTDQTPPYSRYTHNFFIQILSDTGVFGFLTLTALISAVFWQGYIVVKTTSPKRTRLFYLFLFVSLLSSTIFATIDFDWNLPTVFLVFWVFAGFLTNYAK